MNYDDDQCEVCQRQNVPEDELYWMLGKLDGQRRVLRLCEGCLDSPRVTRLTPEEHERLRIERRLAALSQPPSDETLN
jgi:hypothetical protein